MTSKGAAAALHERIWTGGGVDNFPVVAFCGIATGVRIRRCLPEEDTSFLIGLGCLPEGMVYVITEQTLLERLEGWPVGDVITVEQGRVSD